MCQLLDGPTEDLNLMLRRDAGRPRCAAPARRGLEGTTRWRGRVRRRPVRWTWTGTPPRCRRHAGLVRRCAEASTWRLHPPRRPGLVAAAGSLMPRTLWRHARLATMAGPCPGAGSSDGALLTDGEQLPGSARLDDAAGRAWRAAAEHRPRRRPGHPGPGRLPHAPGLRRRPRGEFELRLQGRQLRADRPAGGGIRSTVAATRAASDAQLFASAAARARALMAEGVTTLEIKSGYGLSEAHEARCLRVARRLGASCR
jgi:hypothetical protein